MEPRGKTRHTIATAADWTPILHALEEILPIKYVESGLFPYPQPKAYSSYKELPLFGQARYGDAVQEPRYLVMNKESVVISRLVRLNTGETRYAADHENNPESVVFSPGGILDLPKAVVSGEVSKLSHLGASEVIFRAFAKLIRKHFRNIRAYWVGSEALSLKAEGYRLTSGVRNPLKYDLSTVD